MMPIAIVTGCLSPYVSRLYSAYAQESGEKLTVFQCSQNEPGRLWNNPCPEAFDLKSLPGLRIHRSDIAHVYVNPGIISELARMRPDFILIEAFSPTMLLAGLYAVLTRTPFGIAVEGSRALDPGEHSWIHRACRSFLGRRADMSICTSQAAREMQEHWGVPADRIMYLPHCGSWDAPASFPPMQSRPFDVLFCGTLNERKNPEFFADVIDRMVRDGRAPRVRVVGDGQLRAPLEERLRRSGVDTQFDGYLQKDAIIAAYQSAKLLMFPTLADTWGLVANEAIMCGTPIIASPHAVASGDLVAGFGTGLVRELDVASWAAAAGEILDNPDYWASFLRRRDEAVRHYSLTNAVNSLTQAFAVRHRPRHTTTHEPSPSAAR